MTCNKEVLQNTTQIRENPNCGCAVHRYTHDIWKKLNYVDDVCVEFLRRKIRSDNNSGCTGVRQREDGKWRATMGFKNKRYNLGSFNTFELAVKARKEAEAELHQPVLEKYLKENK